MCSLSVLHPFFILGTSLLVKFLFNFCFAFAVIGRRPLGAPEGNHICSILTKKHLSDITVGQEAKSSAAEEIRNCEMYQVSNLEQQRHRASFLCGLMFQ